MRRLVPRSAALVGAAMLALTACSSGGDDSSLDASDSAAEASTSAVTHIAVAYDTGGRGDGGFNDLAYAGAQEAAAALGAEVTEATARLEDTDADRADRLSLLAESGNNPVVAVGYLYATALAEVAPQYPDTWFAIIDDNTVDEANVVSLTFAEHEGSFLVGVAAAMTSTTGRVGYIGGVDTPLLQKFQAGFEAGAKAAVADIEVFSTYLSEPPDFSGFNDPAAGSEAANGMYDSGVDVIFAAAGGSGSGVFEAAAQAGTMAIGVDNDQYLTADDAVKHVILTSMLKRVDVATSSFIASVADGSVTAGEEVYDLERDGVGYSTSGGLLSEDVIDAINDFSAQIISDEISVPDAIS